MRGHGIDVVAFMTKYFNVNALAVGIEVQVRQDTTLLHTLTPTPVKTTPMWQLGGVKKIMGESGAYGAAHWAHSYEGCTVNLDGDADEFYVVLHSTALGGTFKAQEMSVIGEVL